MKIPFNSTKPISFLVDFNLDLDIMSLFEVDKQQSYYTIVPTIIKIPPIFSVNLELIEDQSYIKFSEFNKDASGVRLLIDIIPKEFHKNLNMSIYRLYSSWCSAETNKIIQDSSSYYTFQGTHFEVDTLQNEITINYYIKYSTKSEIQFRCIVILFITPFLFIGCLLPKERYKTIKFFSIFGIIGEVFYTLLEIRPYYYPINIFDIIILLEIILITLFYFIYKKITKTPICPKCNTNTNVRKRKIKIRFH